MNAAPRVSDGTKRLAQWIFNPSSDTSCCIRAYITHIGFILTDRQMEKQQDYSIKNIRINKTVIREQKTLSIT